MKKLLSVILAIAMIMSLFCAVPVSAEDAVENAVTFYNTYLFEDFEDGLKNTAINTCGSGSGTEIVAADNGSSNAWKLKFNASGAEFGFMWNFTAFKIDANTILRINFRYKIANAASAPMAHIYTAGGTNEAGGASNATRRNIAMRGANADGNWHAAEFELRGHTEAFSPASLRATFTGLGANNELYIDDLEFIVERYAGKETYTMTPYMHNGSPGYANKLYNQGGVSNQKYATDDPADNSNMVFQTAPASDGSATFYLYDGVSRVKVGDTVQLSAKYYVENLTEAGYPDNISTQVRLRNATLVDGTLTQGAHLIQDAEGNFDYAGDHATYDNSRNIHGATPGVWEKFTWQEYTVSSVDDDGDVYIQMNPAAAGTASGNIKYYIDDVTLFVNRADYKYPIVANASARMSKEGVITLAFNWSINNATSGGNYSLVKVKTANGATIASKAGATSITVPEAYRNQPLKVEITPVANVEGAGILGDDTITVDVAAPITVTALKNAAGKQISIAAADAIENAKLIVVAYDATTNKMIDKYITTVNMSENRESATTINKVFEGDNLTYKAMLWVDIDSTLVPLADVLAYDPN